jgi:Flp pilus assembly CpaE family ATPase
MTTAQKDSPEIEVTAAELEERLALLQGISIFFALPDREMRRLARKLRPRHVGHGTVVVKQGDVADRLHIIASGHCEVRATWSPHHSVTVALLSKGEIFGLSAMKGDTPQPASVTALEPTELLELLTSDLDEVVSEDSPAREEMERLVEQRRATIDDLMGHAALVASGHEGRVIAVYSSKGGAGKTTIAVNVAAALAQKHRGECVLLDLGFPYNHAALTANLVPTTSLAAHDGAGDHELEELLLSSCIHHPVGMLVLPGALRVEQSELITPHLVQRALSVLTRNFNYVVVDMGVSISETALGVLERAGEILLIVTPEVTSMKDTRELLDIFQSVLNLPSGQIKVVLNRPRATTMVDRANVERQIGRPVDIELDHDGYRCDRAGVMGELLVMGASTSVLAKRLKSLAASLEVSIAARQDNRAKAAT